MTSTKRPRRMVRIISGAPGDAGACDILRDIDGAIQRNSGEAGFTGLFSSFSAKRQAVTRRALDDRETLRRLASSRRSLKGFSRTEPTTTPAKQRGADERDRER